MMPVSHVIDGVEAIFDDESLVADAGLLVPATLIERLDLESLIDESVRLVGRVGGAAPGHRDEPREGAREGEPGQRGEQPHRADLGLALAERGGGVQVRRISSVAVISSTPTGCVPGRPAQCCRSR